MIKSAVGILIVLVLVGVDPAIDFVVDLRAIADAMVQLNDGDDGGD